jgi:hypothetical protein
VKWNQGNFIKDGNNGGNTFWSLDPNDDNRKYAFASSVGIIEKF